MAYLGNPNIRSADQEIEYNKEMIEEYIKCSEDIIYFAENYFQIVTIDYGKQLIKLFEFQKKMLKVFSTNPVYHEKKKRHCIVKIARQSGKALSLDTPILTPNGFVELVDIKVGDKIYGRDGKETNVSFITETMLDHDVYEIEFDNGEIIKADADHLWTISNSEINRRKFKNKEITLTTVEMLDMFEKFQKRSKPSSIFINSHECLEFDKQSTSIDPYLLGLWIGDGHSSSGRITCHVDDYKFYSKELKKRKIKISEFRLDKRSASTGYFTIYGLERLLKDNNLFNNKHIPDTYIFNSVKVRLDFLRGLMDSDGYMCKRGSCCFYQSDIDIVKKVRLLISTLGIKSTFNEKIIDSKYKRHFYVRFISEKFEVFNLKRKLERQKLIKYHPKNKRIYIKDIRKIDSVPVRCLQVDNKDHLFLCGETLIPTHNTTVATVYLLWYALFHKDKVVAILANKETTAIEILDRIKLAYKHLPIWMQQGVVEGGWNKKSVKLSNGVKIMAASTSSDSISGEAVALLYMDEFAKVKHHIAEEFITATYPVITSGKTSKVIIVSTPVGLNHFYEFWTKAVRGKSNFFPVSVNWSERPGRDEEWKEETIADIGPVRFAQEFQCVWPYSVVNVRDVKSKKVKKVKISDLFESDLYK